MNFKSTAGISVAIFASGLVCAHAQNLNGTVNTGFYGSALAVQTINTYFGNAAGNNDSAGGSELDAAYGRISGGNLYLFLAGNVENNGNHLNVFIDGGAGGQNTLAAPATGTLATMNGSVFSPGFGATFAFDVNNYAGTLYSEEYNLVAATGGYVGALAESSLGIAAGSSGGVTGIYLNNNHASTMGTAGAALSGATSGANTTTGYELVIPLLAIGYTGGNILVLADINGGGDSYLSNQFLPGLTVGSGNLGTAGFNFGSTPGQYFTVSVPEPSTVAMSLSGLAALLAFRRRAK
ncbi:MAG: PEP-CTERM sorting domain-containing protein [Verrucomicrobiia bacterium]